MSIFNHTRLSVGCSLLLFAVLLSNSFASNSWKGRDNFDKIQDLMDAVTADNCRTKTKAELRLPRDSIHQTPTFKTIPKQQWFENRTQLLYMHSLALNRGHFYSSILQRTNYSITDPMNLPGFLYNYFSTAADVSSGDGVINASAIIIDTNGTRPNWLLDDTAPLFAPKAMRRSNDTIEVVDCGNECRTLPYDLETEWIPNTEYLVRYSLYHTQISSVDIDGNSVKQYQLHSFFGPSSPSGEYTDQIAVNFTAPYFDCGKTNKWIVSAVAPIVNIVKRSSEEYLGEIESVGLVIIDTDYSRLDFNPCPASVGNENNFFAGTARCKPTTVCEPLPGFGFRRGGYQCRCAPNYRMPSTQKGPFQGVDIEQATAEEYANGFDCIKSWRKSIDVDLLEPLQRQRRSSVSNETDTENSSNETDVFDPVQFERVRAVLKRTERYSFERCNKKSPSDVEFPGEVGYGADTQFASQARIALRLAHFLV